MLSLKKHVKVKHKHKNAELPIGDKVERPDLNVSTVVKRSRQVNVQPLRIPETNFDLNTFKKKREQRPSADYIRKSFTPINHLNVMSVKNGSLGGPTLSYTGKSTTALNNSAVTKVKENIRNRSRLIHTAKNSTVTNEFDGSIVKLSDEDNTPLTDMTKGDTL